MLRNPLAVNDYNLALFLYKKMNIFRFLSSKKNMEICFKTHRITPFKKIELPSKLLATPRVASRFAACHPPSPPLANPAYAHGLLQRNLFEEMRS